MEGADGVEVEWRELMVWSGVEGADGVEWSGGS